MCEYVCAKLLIRYRVLTCKTAPEFANFRGRDRVKGSISAAKSAKSIEASPTYPDFDDPYKNPLE